MSDDPEAGRGAEDEEISLVDLAATLWRYRRVVIGLTAFSMVAVLAYSIGSLLLPPEKSYLPNLYAPSASILISSDGSSGISAALSASGLGSLASLAGMSVGGSSSGALAVYLAKSPSSIDELNASFNFTLRYKIKKNFKSETRRSVQDRLSVSMDEKTSIITVTYEDWDPEFAQKVVNKLVEILDRRFASLGGSKAKGQRLLLEQKLAEVQSQMSSIEGEIKAFQSRYGVLSIEALASEQIAVLARLRSELILKSMEIENYEKFSKIDDPVIRRLRSERDSIQGKIGELERGGSVLPSQREIPKLAFEYAALQRDLLVQTEIFKILTQQYELAKLNSEGQEAAFQVIELAEVPDQKSGPSRGMICVVATMAGFFLSIMLAFLLEAIKNLRSDPDVMAKLRGVKA